MGVDISGIAPQIIGERPELSNWDTATKYEKERYFNSLDIWMTNNPGVYFRASWWSWRPIYAIALMAIKDANLPFDTAYWDSNDGMGLKTQEECDQLADAIEKFMSSKNADMQDDDDRFYLCLGSWTTVSGSFVPSDVEDKLNEKYPIGTILYQGVVTDDGTLTFPSHCATLSQITNFKNFLRKCGGFEIW
jgi:hypothetical protein